MKLTSDSRETVRKALADYISVLRAASATNYANDRPAIADHLATAALMFLEIENSESAEQLLKYIQNEGAYYGRSFLQGDHGKAVEEAFSKFASLIRDID